MPSGFAGLPVLLQHNVRQSIRLIAPWIVFNVMLSASSAALYPSLFPDEKSRQELQLTVGANPAFALLLGKSHDLTTAAGFTAWRAGALGTLFAALMAIFVVTRNSRGTEDSGIGELIAAAPVARRVRLLAAIAPAAMGSVAMGVVTAFACTIAGIGFANAAALGATYTAAGLMFTGIAAVSAQLASEQRAANTIAVSIAAASHIWRGYVDALGASDWLHWLSPHGWLAEVQPAYQNNWWPLFFALGFYLICLVVALRLFIHRDFGQGLIPQRSGSPRTRMGLWLLPMRLNLQAVISWALGFVLMGFVMGTLASSLGAVFEQNPMMQKFITSGVVNAGELEVLFASFLLQMIAIIAAVFGAQIVLRILAEETDFRTETILAGSVTRLRYLGSNLAIAFGSTGLVFLIGALSFSWFAKGLGIGTWMVLKQGLVTLPAVWVLVGCGIAIVGLRPQAKSFAWVSVLTAFTITMFGPIFKFPGWALGISPLHHVPNILAQGATWGGWYVVCAVTLGLVGAGFVGYQFRDIR